MTQHYIATIDCGRLRIYTEAYPFGKTSARLELVEAMDYPGLVVGDAGGGSMRRETDGSVPDRGVNDSFMSEVATRQTAVSQNTDILAAELDTFLQNRPSASWDFAAPPLLYDAVLRSLSDGTRGRLKCALTLGTVSDRPEDVREQFAAATVDLGAGMGVGTR